MLETNSFSICAPKSIQNTYILITLWNTIPKNKELKCTIANNNIESRFLNHSSPTNFVY